MTEASGDLTKTFVIRVDGGDLVLPIGAETRPLGEVLRAAGHTSVKLPCSEGVCGGCSVQLDGLAVPSCLVPTARAIGADIRTATTLTDSGVGELLATELASRGGLQCGYCIPGFVAAATAWLGATGERADARSALVGHLCRCTGYTGLFDALTRAEAGAPSEGSPRVDGIAKARGTADYAADGAPPGSLIGLLLTCRSAHALVSIRSGTAMEVEGAVCVLTADDVPTGLFSVNPHTDDEALAPLESALLNREGRFIGDIVGLVVADNLAAAREMASRVLQSEERLAAVLTIEEAERDGAPHVRQADKTNVTFAFDAGATRSEVEASLATADHVVTNTYRVMPGPIGAMERITAAAQWIDRRCLIWSTSQTPAVVPRRVARLLDIDETDVEVQPLYLGGGFGLKEEVFLEPLAAAASRVCGGRPVLIEATRAQVSSLRRRHGVRIELTTGCRKDGTTLARSLRLTFDAGGEVSHSSLVLLNAATLAMALYPAPCVRLEGQVVLTNTTPSGAFRGYGAGEVTFALESHADEIARILGLDRLEYRRRHVLRAGGRDEMNEWKVASFASDECLRRLLDLGWNEPLSRDPTGRWQRGRGMAHLAIVSSASSKGYTDVAHGACRLDVDGMFVVETGVVEMGQGIHSSFASIAAERLGIDVSQVRVETLGPGSAPLDEGTFASRGVYVSGNAVADAAGALQRELVRLAAERRGVSPTSCSIEPRGVRVGDVVIPFAELAPARGEGRRSAPDAGLVSGAQMAEVAVDTLTGRVVVERVVSVHDVGRLIDEKLATGQVVGGVIQGIGLALTERLRHSPEGQPIEINLLDQMLPNALSPTAIVAAFVGDGRAGGELAAKGLGEAPAVGITAAIANAIHDATGIRITTTPMSPEIVLVALDEYGEIDAGGTTQTLVALRGGAESVGAAADGRF